MEGPHIKINLLGEHEFSTTPEDGNFGHMLKHLNSEEEALLGDTLRMLDGQPTQKEAILRALQDHGRSWQDFAGLISVANMELINSFKALVTDWESKTEEENKKRVATFAKLVDSKS